MNLRFVAAALVFVASSASADKIAIQGPSDSVSFGLSVATLPNGNIVVTDPYVFENRGAAYLYGRSGNLISTLKGADPDDYVGAGGISVLRNGNYVVLSPGWNEFRGAVTWASAGSGIEGVVSPQNSLVGASPNDLIAPYIGKQSVVPLDNGNYVVLSLFWDNGDIVDAGAVTWGNGNGGTVGEVSAANSLVGSHADDNVGEATMVEPLANGNYVVRSPFWDNDVIEDAGAVTWANGNGGTVGVITAFNSLVGTHIGDSLGTRVYELANSNYIALSVHWSSDTVSEVGAVSWGNGMGGTVGVVSSANSLVGSTTQDLVGSGGITALTNGNYVVSSPSWDRGVLANVGASTWGNGTVGVHGEISVANSLLGVNANDQVGFGAMGYVDLTPFGATALSDGNYVVRSPGWDNGPLVDVGAVTWADGQTGATGNVSLANSLVGGSAGDNIGYTEGNFGVVALKNGHYVVCSPFWDNGATANAGAATWMHGGGVETGTVSAANSMIGARADDYVAADCAVALTNGHYVISSAYWDNDAVTDAGAATWMNGFAPSSGIVAVGNSLVGSHSHDNVGWFYSDYGKLLGIRPLANGNYIVGSRYWDNETTLDAGAVTWRDGQGSFPDAVSAGNSLVGTQAEDGVGRDLAVFGNGEYLVDSPSWGNQPDEGALTYAVGDVKTNGNVNAANSLTPGSHYLARDHDPLRNALVLGDTVANRVVIVRLDGIFMDGLEGTTVSQ